MWHYDFQESCVEMKVKQYQVPAKLMCDVTLFQRRPTPGNSRLTESRCSSCSSFLGASGRQDLLDCVEKMHVCKASRIEPKAWFLRRCS